MQKWHLGRFSIFNRSGRRLLAEYYDQVSQKQA
jgi:hypothetical protein